MKVQVRYFAMLRERLAKTHEVVDVPEGTTAGELLCQVAVGPAAGLAGSTAVAVNLEYARPDQVLSEGDEVAFLPPVSGG